MGMLRRMFGLEAPPAPPRRTFAHSQRVPTVGGGAGGDANERQRDRGNVLAPGLVFTPTQPKPGSRQLTGRQAELRRILQALTEDRAHVVLYSERGRGKTSLSNMIVEALRRNGVIVARHTCEADSDFDSILRGLLRDLPASLLASPVTDVVGEGCESALPDRTLRPGDVVSLPSRLACRALVCLIDEFDRVQDSRTRTQIADAVKQVSDRDVPLSLLIVGVSENLDQILGQHPSIQRSVLGIHLPLFTDRDVAQLIAKGGRESGFNFPAAIIERIVILSRGMPYMAQLLGLRLTQAAAERNDTIVSEADFDTAVERLVGDANPRIVALYDGLTDRLRDATMIDALRRIAIAPQDQWGRLEVTLLPDGGATVGGRRLSAATWTRLDHAEVLAPVAGSIGLYVFAERSLMHHVLLLATHDIANASPHTEPERASMALRPLTSDA